MCVCVCVMAACASGSLQVLLGAPHTHLLECKVCMERFSSSADEEPDRRPLALGCGHVLCAECVRVCVRVCVCAECVRLLLSSSSSSRSLLPILSASMLLLHTTDDYHSTPYSRPGQPL